MFIVRLGIKLHKYLGNVKAKFRATRHGTDYYCGTFLDVSNEWNVPSELTQ